MFAVSLNVSPNKLCISNSENSTLPRKTQYRHCQYKSQEFVNSIKTVLLSKERSEIKSTLQTSVLQKLTTGHL